MSSSPTFKIPDRAKEEMRQRPVVKGGKVMIEYPNGSGIFAAYWPEEREIMRKLSEHEREIVHLIKAEFDGQILVDPYLHVS